MIDDLSTDPRWPEFGVRAAEETSVRSMMSFQLATSTATLGALNLYSRKPEAFDGRAHALGAILAAHAAVAVSAAQQQHKAEHLDHALASSRQIGIAMDIPMADHRRTEDEAFLALRDASIRLNIKLRDVAARVVQAGELVEVAARPRPVGRIRRLPRLGRRGASGAWSVSSMARITPSIELSEPYRALASTRAAIVRPRRFTAHTVISCGPLSPVSVCRTSGRMLGGEPDVRVRTCSPTASFGRRRHSSWQCRFHARTCRSGPTTMMPARRLVRIDSRKVFAWSRSSLRS